MKEQGFAHKKSLSQNFIEDESVQDSLAECAGVGADDAVLEIGAGAGGLTRALAARAGRVVALETDPRLIPILQAKFAADSHVRIVHADVLRADLNQITESLGTFSVVANLPYHITTPVLELLLGGALPIRSIHVMVQNEVSGRILAKPGDKSWGMLSILCQYRAQPQIAMELPARLFTPPPHVDSVFVSMPYYTSSPFSVRDEQHFLRTARAVLAMRRKTLQNNLTAAFSMTAENARRAIEACGLRPDVRGETLPIETLARLSEQIQKINLDS